MSLDVLSKRVIASELDVSELQDVPHKLTLYIFLITAAKFRSFRLKRKLSFVDLLSFFGTLE